MYFRFQYKDKIKILNEGVKVRFIIIITFFKHSAKFLPNQIGLQRLRQ